MAASGVIADKTGMKVQPLAASLRTLDEYSNAVFNALSAVDDHIATYASTAEPIRTDAASPRRTSPVSPSVSSSEAMPESCVGSMAT